MILTFSCLGSSHDYEGLRGASEMKGTVPEFRGTQFGRLPSNFRIESLTDYVFYQEGPGLRKWQWTDGGMKVINGRNLLLDGRIDLSNTDRYISQIEFEDTYSHFAIEPGDIVVTSSGTIGKVARIREEHLPLMMNTSVIRFHPHDPEKLEPDYLFTFLRSPAFQQQARSFAIGAAQLNFGPIHLKQMKIIVPPHRVQRAIAGVVSAYDDLIENNRRRIQLLEQAARLLYKEWFVHLRFPGHEHTRIVDGVPETWERKTLEGIAESVSYGLTASSTPDEVGPRFLRITDIVPPTIDWERVPYCEASDEEIARNRLQAGDVVVARTGATVGYAKRLTWLPEETVFASYLVRFRFSSPETSLIAGLFMESELYREFVRNHAGGAAQPNANAKVLGSAPLLVPTADLRKYFSNAISDAFQQRDTLVRLISRLTHARDLLLPRLMRGEIVV